MPSCFGEAFVPGRFPVGCAVMATKWLGLTRTPGCVTLASLGFEIPVGLNAAWGIRVNVSHLVSFANRAAGPRTYLLDSDICSGVTRYFAA